jgi:regulator of protease activity HflC (stomatin/prohibitin superfamily)
MGFVALAIVVLVIVVLAKYIRIVPQGMNYTILNFGKYERTAAPGLTFLTPIVQSIGSKVNMMEQVVDVPPQMVITRDNASVHADGVLYYQVTDAAKATYNVANLRIALLNLTMTNIRTVMGSMDLDELLSKRDEINHHLMRTVHDATEAWGVKVTRIELLNIEPPRDLVDSMARQLKAERDKRATILTSEGDKQAAILRAEGELQAARLQAEARERLAQAEANATRSVSEAVASGNIQALNYFVAQKYIEALHAFASSPNQKTLLLPVEASAAIGSLAGIAELVKESAAKSGAR